MVGCFLLTLPTLVWVTGGVFLHEFGVSADETPVKINHPSAPLNSSHHFKKQQTWRSFQYNLSPINIQHLPAHCKHTAVKHGPWMLLKVFLKGCYLHHKSLPVRHHSPQPPCLYHHYHSSQPPCLYHHHYSSHHHHSSQLYRSTHPAMKSLPVRHHSPQPPCLYHHYHSSQPPCLYHHHHSSHLYRSAHPAMKHLLRIEEEVKEVKEQVATNTAILQKLGGGVGADLCLVHETNMPLSNLEELKELERQLGSDIDLKNQLVNILAVVGGETTKDAVKRMLGRSLKTSLALKINWTGAGGKVAFKSLQLKNVLHRAVRRVVHTATEEELQKEVATYLKGAADKEGGRKDRQKKVGYGEIVCCYETPVKINHPSAPLNSSHHFKKQQTWRSFQYNLSPINIQHLPAHCKHTAVKHGPWMLLKVFLKGCYLHHKVMKRMRLDSLTVQYFDRLLMQNITGVASCLSLTPPRPASTKAAAPVVMCKKHELLVKLPGRALKQVSVSGEQPTLDRIVI
ncbi:hypothetical protein ACEWY4_005224 [Coilia grayii]|uniref:DUF4806 domain-containing protein n=1 Tax=Coilia grayii TaxID=363190 RepID=A0ABD1KHP4_9TELE